MEYSYVSSLAREGEIGVSHKIIIVLNTAWNLINFRAGLIRGLLAEGFTVIAVAPDDKYSAQLSSMGCQFIALPMSNQGKNPAQDFLLIWRLFFLLRRERPDVLLAYTVKPNIYASLAAATLGIPTINNIAGLGTVFVRNTWLTKIVKFLYRLSLSRSKKVFFQNVDDMLQFKSNGLVQNVDIERLPGSGVDLDRFSVQDLPSASDEAKFLLVARMLWEKGVGDYVNAARIIKKKYPNIKFYLLGFLDSKNSKAISKSQIDEWVNEDLVEYLGVSDDVRAEISSVDCVVLPSFYREGVPRTLLEAAAMGRPIITADSVGCRDAIEDGITGFLCKQKSPVNLAEKMERIISLSRDERIKMGQNGRKKVKLEFDERIVIKKYLKTISTLVANK